MEADLQAAIANLARKIEDNDSGSAAHLENKLDEYFASQVEADTERERTRKKFWKAAAWVIGVVTFGGGGGTYAYLRNQPKPVAAAEVKQTVEDRVGAVETAIRGCPAQYDDGGKLLPCAEHEHKGSLQGTSERNVAKIERLGDLSMSQRDLTVESYDGTRKLLEAINKKAKNVEEPPSIQRARTQNETYKKAKQKEIESALDQGDPFAGLE